MDFTRNRSSSGFRYLFAVGSVAPFPSYLVHVRAIVEYALFSSNRDVEGRKKTKKQKRSISTKNVANSNLRISILLLLVLAHRDRIQVESRTDDRTVTSTSSDVHVSRNFNTESVKSSFALAARFLSFAKQTTRNAALRSSPLFVLSFDDSPIRTALVYQQWRIYRTAERNSSTEQTKNNVRKYRTRKTHFSTRAMFRWYSVPVSSKYLLAIDTVYSSPPEEYLPVSTRS